MIKIYSLIIVSFIYSGLIVNAQEKDTVAIRFSNTINQEDLYKHLSIIASDEFEGRETGKPGQKKAAEYIKNQFKSFGLQAPVDGSYFQIYPLVLQTPSGVDVSIKGIKYEFLKDFYFFPGFKDGNFSFDSLTFLGFGIKDENYNDFKNIDVTGKALLIFNGEPFSKKNISYVSGTSKATEWTTAWKKKVRTAGEQGVAALFIVVDDVSSNVRMLRYFIENPTMKLDNDKEGRSVVPAIFISKEMAAAMLERTGKEKSYLSARKSIEKKGEPKKFTFKTDIELTANRQNEKITSENVLGFIEGTDLKDEVLVITAHYDHLGTDGKEIYNGADDDGSGTVAVIELAEAFALAKKEGKGPRRSILFMAVSGEEKGLFGSQYYVENPIFPLDNTIVNLNIDMVGRVDKKHKEKPDYVYIIGSDKLSTELHVINEKSNILYMGMDLDYTYNRPNDPNRFYYRSDHYNFAKNNIPVIFYFNGSHEDYHKPTDTVDKINFEALSKRAKLVFFTAWELANRDGRIKVDVISDFDNTR
jgi:hypothetical protein